MASGIGSSPGRARVFSSRVAATDRHELASVAQSYRQMTTTAQIITSVLVTAATSPPAFGEAVTKLNDACHSAAANTLPPLLLYSHVRTIAPASTPRKNPGRIQRPMAV